MKRIVVLMIGLSFLICACGRASDTAGSEQVSEENSWNIYTYSETANGFQSTMNEYPISDENELENLLTKAESELKVPSYIPDGYTFESANLFYYVTKDMLDGLTAEEKAGEDGEIKYQYILPDDVLTQIDGFDITYRNESGEEIFICVNYVESMEMKTNGSDSFQETEAANYEISRAGILYEQYVGEFFRKALPVYEYLGGGEKTLSCIFVNISMSDMENEQVVKIAESM